MSAGADPNAENGDVMNDETEDEKDEGEKEGDREGNTAFDLASGNQKVYMQQHLICQGSFV